MKTPIDTVRGYIVDYDDRTQEVIIRAKYTDWFTMCKREYRECIVQMLDGRKLSDKQRKTCYKLLRAISDYTGMGLDPTKEYMKLKFLSEDLEETADKIFSLSNAPMSLVCAFQRFLVRFIVDWEIPCEFPLLEFVDDVDDYIYACIAKKKCCICGRHADLHHVDRVGMGRDREEIIHEGMEALPLCRFHHSVCHTLPQEEFNERFHIPHGIVMNKDLCKIYGLKRSKEKKEYAE